MKGGGYCARLFFYTKEMKLRITTQPTGTDILPLSTAKEFLRVDSSDEDVTITALIDAAVQHCQDYTNRHFVVSNFNLYLDDFYNCSFDIGPLVTVAMVQYLDGAGVSQTLPSAKYWADVARDPGRIKFDSPPDTYDDAFNVVTINGTIGEVPKPPIVHAIKMLVAHYYENRRAAVVGTLTSEMPLGVSALLNPYRIIALK